MGLQKQSTLVLIITCMNYLIMAKGLLDCPFEFERKTLIVFQEEKEALSNIIVREECIDSKLSHSIVKSLYHRFPESSIEEKKFQILQIFSEVEDSYEKSFRLSSQEEYDIIYLINFWNEETTIFSDKLYMNLRTNFSRGLIFISTLNNRSRPSLHWATSNFYSNFQFYGGEEQDRVMQITPMIITVNDLYLIRSNNFDPTNFCKNSIELQQETINIEEINQKIKQYDACKHNKDDYPNDLTLCETYRDSLVYPILQEFQFDKRNEIIGLAFEPNPIFQDEQIEVSFYYNIRQKSHGSTTKLNFLDTFQMMIGYVIFTDFNCLPMQL